MQLVDYGSVFTLRKFYAEQMFVLVSMQLRNHENAHDQSSVLRGKWAVQYIYALNFECCKSARIRIHRANGLEVLRSCAPYRGNIVTDVNNVASI